MTRRATLTAQQISDIRKWRQLGRTHKEIARLVGCSPNQARHYSAGALKGAATPPPVRSGYRTCHDCGCRGGMALPRKPRKRIDLCADCADARELRGVPREQVPQRRAELTELYRQGAYRGLPRARPLPLFSRRA